MSKTRRGRSTFSDGDVDSLLRKFFRDEVPASLPAAGETAAHADPPRLAAVGRAGSARDRRPAGWIGLSAVAGSLLSIAVLLPQPAAERPGGRFASSTEREDGEAGRAAQLADDSEDHPDTLNGPVEQRMRKVMVFDPETGEQVEMLLPELEIEIFPIDDDDSDE